MKKLIPIFIILISLMILSGCANQTTCNKPYILVGENCCLDKDSNNICDSDEVKVCSDECTESTCSGNDFIACEKQADGCNDRVNKGKVIRACNIECLGDSDCHVLGMECVGYTCKYSESQCSDECSQDSCESRNYIKCEFQADGCKYKNNLGKVIGQCGVECLSDIHCSEGISCNYNQCWNPPQTTSE